MTQNQAPRKVTPIPLEKYPVRQFLDLPVTCLTRSTQKLLDKWTRDVRSKTEEPPVLVARTRYGWWIYAFEEIPADQERFSQETGIPQDLIDCMIEARSRGCEYINADSDAKNETGLPEYEETNAKSIKRKSAP